jgi:hypothetical protein
MVFRIALNMVQPDYKLTIYKVLCFSLELAAKVCTYYMYCGLEESKGGWWFHVRVVTQQWSLYCQLHRRENVFFFLCLLHQNTSELLLRTSKYFSNQGTATAGCLDTVWTIHMMHCYLMFCKLPSYEAHTWSSTTYTQFMNIHTYEQHENPFPWEIITVFHSRIVNCLEHVLFCFTNDSTYEQGFGT